MNDNTNTLRNFTVRRDGEISRWETAKPQVQHNFRSFGRRLWANTCEFAACIDEAIPASLPIR